MALITFVKNNDNISFYSENIPCPDMGVESPHWFIAWTQNFFSNICPCACSPAVKYRSYCLRAFQEPINSSHTVAEKDELYIDLRSFNKWAHTVGLRVDKLTANNATQEKIQSYVDKFLELPDAGILPNDTKNKTSPPTTIF